MSTSSKNADVLNSYDRQLGDWIELEKAAIELIHIIGDLWFNRSVELIIFRNQLVDRSASQILNLHQYAKDFVKKPISIMDTVAIAAAIRDLDLAPSRIDIGKLGAEWISESAE
jgi:glyceraldehyde 3-phosphate dehydrogenase